MYNNFVLIFLSYAPGTNNSNEAPRIQSRNSSFGGSLPLNSNPISSKAPSFSNITGSRTSSFSGISALGVPQYDKVCNVMQYYCKIYF